MKTQITSLLLATSLAALVGCASPDKGAAYGHEQQFRQQLMESDLVKRNGFHIQDLRFSKDYRKALVIGVYPDSAPCSPVVPAQLKAFADVASDPPFHKTSQPVEYVLVSDDFGRYHHGDTTEVDLRKFAGLNSTPTFQPEFRQQLSESIPVKQYGYTIKELTFSKHYNKALVVFTHPTHRDAAGNNRRPDMKFVLALDDFGIYRGNTMQPFYTPGTASTPSIQITVTMPKR